MKHSSKFLHSEVEYSFDDVLIVPKFSTISSRRNVDISLNWEDFPKIDIPIISANMDTITGSDMAKAMTNLGAQACLHRFGSIDSTVKMFVESGSKSFVSIGIGPKELERAEALNTVGAKHFVIDVANGAQDSVVQQAKSLREIIKDNATITIGNFASVEGVLTFLEKFKYINGIKVGIGPGSACTTRIKTGVGYPQLSAIHNISQSLAGHNILVIADGGMKTAGDVCKSLAAGAGLCMLGGMLAGTKETPGQLTEQNGKMYKMYRGSASKESYVDQNKISSWRAAEGETFFVDVKGSVDLIIADIEGGIRSAFSYTNSSNLKEFQNNSKFVFVSSNSVKENGAHGKSV